MSTDDISRGARFEDGGRLADPDIDGDVDDVPTTTVTLVETSTGLVAVPDRDLPPLTDEIVLATLDEVRR